METRPRLAFFQQNLAYGATEHYLSTLLKRVDRARFDVHLLCPAHSQLRLLLNLSQKGVSVRPYSPSLLAGGSLRVIREFRRVFREIDPALVHFNDPCVSGMLSAKFAGVPILIMTHHTPELTRRYNWRGRLLERIAFVDCRPFAIFTSEQDRQTGIRKDRIHADRCAVIPYFVDVAAFSMDVDHSTMRREMNIPAGHRVVGNVARLVNQKGHVYLVEAAKEVVSRQRDVVFLIVGDGELRDSLMREVEVAGLARHFIFTGHRRNVASLLNLMDVFVMPSTFEGLCLAVMEASAAARPVVATGVGGIPSTVVDGETGLLVPPRDPGALAEATVWMLEHPDQARQMGLRGQRRMAALFTEKMMVSRTETLYMHLLSNGA